MIWCQIIVAALVALGFATRLVRECKQVRGPIVDQKQEPWLVLIWAIMAIAYTAVLAGSGAFSQIIGWPK